MDDIIKCHMCKLSLPSCNFKCMELDDVSVLVKDSCDPKSPLPKGFCTFHKCQYNPSGFQCVLSECALGFGKNSSGQNEN